MILRKDTNLKKLTKKGKSLLLAYDHGLEHGSIDFNDKNVNPEYIIEIAKKGEFNGLIVQKGIAEKYYDLIRKNDINLILKLNGKTSLVKGDPISRQITTVKEALSLGALAVGYTVYIGSIHESIMLQELENIQREAHEKGLPVIGWIYPRGEGIKDKKDVELMSYATRVALELGLDFVKIHPCGEIKDLKWAVKVAGEVKVLAAGGFKSQEEELLNQIKIFMNAGFAGLAIGRNIWQSDNPLQLTKKIKKIVFN